jgi:hypothetical protein
MKRQHISLGMKFSTAILMVPDLVVQNPFAFVTE